MRKIHFSLLAISLLVLPACGSSDPQALEKEACQAFIRGVDRLNVDDTADESFGNAYEAFDELSQSDSFFTKFGNIAYRLSQPDSNVSWADIDEVSSYCGDPVFSE